MGKRSRKRGVPERSGGASASATTRAERDAARERRAQALERGEGPSRPARRRMSGKTSFEDRPPAPWGSFPLVEIVVLIALVLLVGSFFVGTDRRAPMLLGGLALGSLGGLELSIREHFGGFRSHSALLGGAVAAVAITITYFVTKGSKAGVAMVPVGGVVFVAAFYAFRQAFMRRTGGVGFRR
jgi:peptidoglycan/LPS O-acetylase OafA/YrhL